MENKAKNAKMHKRVDVVLFEEHEPMEFVLEVKERYKKCSINTITIY